jgi:hypothetical protein
MSETDLGSRQSTASQVDISVKNEIMANDMITKWNQIKAKIQAQIKGTTDAPVVLMTPE